MPVIGLQTTQPTKPQEPSQAEDIDIALKVGNTLFIAKESNDYLMPLSGFFIKTDIGYIVSELTLVKGIQKTKTDKGNIISIPATCPIIFFNNNGNRGYCSIEDKLTFVGRSISFKKMQVKFEEIPHSLMSYGTGKRFLNNETPQIKDIYDRLKAKQGRFVSYHWDPRLNDLLACLTIATYFFDVFGVFAVVWFFGGFETGKGRSLKSIVHAGRKGMLVDDTTYASVVRLADLLQPTLGIDEYQDVKHLLQGFLRSSYKEGIPATRLQETKDCCYELKLFAHFQPTIIASTEEIDEGSLTRAITIKTKKGNPAEDRDPTEHDFDDIRSDLYLCRLPQANTVLETFRTLKREELGLFGREWEIWRAPLTVAKMVNEEIFNNLLSLSREMGSSKRQNIYVEEKAALKAIRALFESKGRVKILMFYPKEITEMIWTAKSSEFTADKWENDPVFKSQFSPARTGFILKRMGIQSKLVTKGTQYTITQEDFTKLALDYCAADSSTTCITNTK
jgi:hypothetical protein